MATSAYSSSSPKKGSPRILLGEIDLFSFYHKGAVLRNHAGEHVLLLEGWGRQEGARFGHAAKVVRCDPGGTPLASAKEGFLDQIPSTALYQSRGGNGPLAIWARPVTLVKSATTALPHGISSDDPSLVLVPYGPHFGKPIGLLSDTERQALAKFSKNARFRQAVEQAKPLPGARQDRRQLLSQAGLDVVRQQQGELVRSIPLVTVIEQYLGYAPEEITGKVRKYRVGAEFINLNTDKNSFGSLNDYVFKTLKRDRGSSNNAMDIVAAVREMEGASVDFRTIREGLIKHFNLQAQLDSIFKEALRREQEASRNGTAVEYAPAPSASVDDALKDAAAKQTAPEEEVPFDLATGAPVGSAEADRGGGFAEREELWPAARKYLVEERKLDPSLIDYLYENRSLYAARRSFPSSSRFPYRANHQDVIVAPIFGFKTGQVVGVDTKPLPRKPGEKTEGRNHGRTSQGAFMFGQWGPETKRVVLTEGFIKGIAFLQLFRKEMNLGPETCILSRSGAKPTLEIIPQLKEWGAEAIVAFDNDFTGRDKSRKFYDECARQGVPCREMFVEPSEVTVAISKQPHEGYHDESRAKAIEESLVKFATERGIAWAHDSEAQTEDQIAIRLPNTDEVIKHVETILKDDRTLSGREFQARAKDLPEDRHEKLAKHRWVRLSIHSKDWDDVVKRGPLSPSLAAASPAQGLPPQPPQIKPVPAEEALVGKVISSASSVAEAIRRISDLAAEVQSYLEAAGESLPPRGGEAVAAAEKSPPGGALAAETTEAGGAKEPAPAQASIVPAFLVSRPSKDKGVIFSVGTAETVYDLAITPEQVARAGGLLAEELPRPAELMQGARPRLVSITDVDGSVVDAVSAIGDDVELVAAPEVVQRGWRNPRSPAIVEAVSHLRRGGCLPVPMPSVGQPTLVQK